MKSPELKKCFLKIYFEDCPLHIPSINQPKTSSITLVALSQGLSTYTLHVSSRFSAQTNRLKHHFKHFKVPTLNLSKSQNECHSQLFLIAPLRLPIATFNLPFTLVLKKKRFATKELHDSVLFLLLLCDLLSNFHIIPLSNERQREAYTYSEKKNFCRTSSYSLSGTRKYY